jgi:hypothetical protein
MVQNMGTALRIVELSFGGPAGIFGATEAASDSIEVGL